MSNRTVVEGLLTRLNAKLSSDDAAADLVATVLEKRFFIGPQALAHLSDHVSPEGDPPKIGVLGMINWAIAVQAVPWGTVTATYDGPGGKLLSLAVQE